MAIEDLAGDFFTPTRDTIRDTFQRDYKVQRPEALIGEGTTPYVDGSVIADALMPVYANCLTLARSIDYDQATLEQLTAECARIGIPAPFPAVGGTGYVTIDASVGGGIIYQGDELKDPQTGLRFQVQATALYIKGSQVPIVGYDVGTQTNLAAGTTLVFKTARPGILSSAVVAANGRGKGIEGGRSEETTGEIAKRIRAAKAEPPAAGNDAEIRKWVQKTPGVPVQEVFTFPCANGPGTTCYVFTLAPSTAGASRTPSLGQGALARSYMIGNLPKDDGIIDCTLLEVATDVQAKVSFAPGAEGWLDVVTWPPFDALTPPAVLASTSATTFTVNTSTQPQAGVTFAFFDAAAKVFRRKRVLSSVVNGGGGYDIVCDATNAASDLSYTPVVGDIACPYSASLDLLVTPMLESFGALGPGEMFDPFYDPGFRQKRNPPSPKNWTSTLNSKAFNNVSNLSALADFQVVSPALPMVTPVGTALVSVNLLVLGKLAFFPL